MDAETFNISVLEELKPVFDKLKSLICKERNTTDENIESDTIQQLFTELISLIDINLENCEKSCSDHVKLLSMKASLMYEQAKLKLFQETGEDSLTLLETIIELIREYSEHDSIIFLYLRIVNHFAYLMAKAGKLETARQLLENVLDKEYSPNISVYSTENLFSLEQTDAASSRFKFSKLILNNIQMLGWVYGKLGLKQLHAFMEHLHLQKQLDAHIDFSVVHWISKCCRLVTIHLTSYNWPAARYYLAAAGAILAQKSSQIRSVGEMAHSRAELSKAWIHYGLHLFSASKKKLLEEIYNNDVVAYAPTAPKTTTSASASSSAPEEFDDVKKFQNLPVTIPTIPANFVKETADARTLFVHTQNWLKQLRCFYTLKDYPFQYVNAVLDLSELYRFLAFYETDLESQYNVQKRRSDTLEALSSLLKEVRPNCYVAVSVELWRELAEVQIELMGINLKRLYTYDSQQETAEGVQKRIDAVSIVHDKLETVGDSTVGSLGKFDDVQQKKTAEVPNESENGDCVE